MRVSIIVRKWIAMLPLLLMLVTPLAAREITLATIDYPPFYGKDLPENGPMGEMVTRAFADQGYRVNIMFLPWARALEWSRKGKIDGMLGVWYSQKRIADFRYSNPIMPNEIGFYKRKGEKIRYQNYADLKQQGYVLGSVKGYVQPTGLEESGIPIMYVSNDLQNFKILSKKRVDLIVVDKAYASYILGQPELHEFADNIEWMAPVLEKKQQYLMLSRKTKNSKQKIADFNAGLRKLKQSGEFKDILAKHHFGITRAKRNNLLPQTTPAKQPALQH